VCVLVYLLPGAGLFTPYFSVFSKSSMCVQIALKIFEDLLVLQQKNLSCLMQ